MTEIDICDHGRPDHQEMLRLLREALGLPGPPRPKTPAEVFEECLAECRRLRSVTVTYR